MSSSWKTVTSTALVSASRLDVFSKTDFVESRVRGYQTSWSRTLFREYLRATRPDGKFSENNTKFSLEDYEIEFIRLIDSMRVDGFDSTKGRIPVGKSGIINGAHRLATAICLGIDVEIEESSEEDQVYDFHFMRRIGLSNVFRQQMVWNLIKRRNDTRAYLLTGISGDMEKKIVRAITEFAQVVSVERIELTQIGERRLMELAYSHNDWWCSRFRETMVAERFTSGNSHCTIVFIIGTDLNLLGNQKDYLRTILGDINFDRQIHGTDTYSDTITLGEVLLNKNGVQFMNTAPLDSESRVIDQVGGPRLFNSCSDVEIPWCIDGSAVLEIFGIRRARDIDYVALDGHQIIDPLVRFGDDHKKEFQLYPLNYDDVILDPRLHFRYLGLKIMSLPTITYVKNYLLDPKAIEDIDLITRFVKHDGPIYKDQKSNRTARIWRIELFLGSIYERTLSILPKKYVGKIRHVVSICRKRGKDI